MLQLEAAALSDIGRKRDNQEDAFLVDDAHRLYAVADGMGGHLAGEIASRMAVDSLRAAADEADLRPAASADGSLSPEAGRLVSWIREANRNVYERSLCDERCRGMGSTVAALFFVNDRFVAANVGDSPIYLVRGGRIEMLSAMHTAAAERPALDPMARALLSGLLQHMLTRAVGIDAEVQPHVRERDCRAGDIFIICSDGLSNALRPEEMPGVVRQANAGEACRKFVDLANRRGGDDNITVIVIKAIQK